jgi:uncharacterized protein
MATNVYFTKVFDDEHIKQIFSKALTDLPIPYETDDSIAIKVHFGEKGNSRFVQPAMIKPILEELNSSKCFLTDTNTLYIGMRLNAKDHLMIAKEHGFGVLNTPIVIADGELGEDEVAVPINGNIFDKVKIGKYIAEADGIVAISHFKGHCLFGFGGALKNIGMGCGSRAGKLAMHSKVKPSINETCIGCNKCIKVCPADAITILDGKAKIEDEKCIGCARCIATCDTEAVSIPWGGASSEEAMERCAEYALGAALSKKCVYITFINNIAKDCDCAPDSEIIGEDVGIVASIDPVACDQAAYDLVKEKHGRDIFEKEIGIDGTHFLHYAEKIGIGSRKYSLIKM